ncbi:DsbA family protein [Zhihengliuella halotolerans]|uniref:DSBA-like thioredoxin domain-containing protein n=1 Tax=Zhihengliuella halotolerans TaxID=370736 RepID=A0A4Q8AGP3_9MICC|nr:DsbA family protein [Zhihengliuella halotolerans]RZU62893.1 putative protein-disulfide isomerase [Zhihengliuella halotolerans]
MHLIYVFDAYCGWSYGFTDTLGAIARRHPELEVTVVSGGLFTGNGVRPIREFGSVRDINARISDSTGVEFGSAYEDLVTEGSFAMDSADAARGVAALRALSAPSGMPSMIRTLHEAFFIHGLSLSDPQTIGGGGGGVAARKGLDPDEARRGYLSPASETAAREDLAMAAQLGVSGFPTLLVADGQRSVVLGAGAASSDDIERRLEHARAALTAASSSHAADDGVPASGRY